MFVLLPFVGYSQNSSPTVQVTNAVVDTLAKTISVNYQVNDGDNDSLEIRVFLSADSGISYIAPIQNVSGDFGFPVFSGNNKNLVLQYNTDSLHQAAQYDIQKWFRIKIIASDRKPIAIESLLQSIDSALVLNYMQYLAQKRHHISAPGGLSAVKDSIESNFLRNGLQTQRLPFNFGNVASENIVGRKPGFIKEKNTIIVDAHFDAVANTQGADDNASSLAAMLISSQILSSYNFKKTLKFIGFDKEESGLKGSLFYVNNSIPYYENIDAVLNGEMIGYYNDSVNSQTIPNGFSTLFPAAVDSINSSGNRGIWLFTVGNTNSATLAQNFDSIARLYVDQVKTLILSVPGNGQIAQDLRRSDHAVFWDAGYKALMLTDGADFRNANYHTPGDSLSTLNIPFLTRNIKAITAVAAELAQPLSAGSDSYGSWQLIKDVPFSLPKNELSSTVMIYPIPAQQQLYIKTGFDSKYLSLSLKDNSGKEIGNKNYQKINGNQVYSISLSGLTPGVYLIQGNCEQGNFTKRVVVSKDEK